MKLHIRASLTGIAAVVLVAAAPVVAGATNSGLAFDSVTRFQMAADSPPQPGSFAADFQAASSLAPADDAPRGPFGLGKAIAAARTAMATFKTGSAERHYVAGSKQRVDAIALGTSEILDCSARTRTTLDHKGKTYTIASLDRPVAAAAGKHAPERPEPTATDDGSKVAIALSTRSLGAKTLEGASTAGYESTVKTTVTKATGESQSFDMGITAYYSAFAQPVQACPAAASVVSRTPAGAGAMANYALAMRALRTPKGDPRFTVTNTAGPALPTGKFALWEVVSLKGEKGAAFNVLTERGNVRSVAENDPVFAVPSDYTKMPDSM